MPASQRKIEANRRNAQKSTGPRTARGKAQSRANATTHGLFCADLVLPGENERQFKLLRRALLMRFRPDDVMEMLLVDRIVSAMWKLRRLQQAEAMLHVTLAAQLAQSERDIRRAERHFDQRPQQRFGYMSGDEAGIDRKSVRATDDDELPREPIPQPLQPALVLGMRLNDPDDVALERLSRYEHRLELTISRSLRDLRSMRALREKEQSSDDPADLLRDRDLPWSPELDQVEPREPEPAANEDQEQHEEQQHEEQNQQAQPSVRAGARSNEQNEAKCAGKAGEVQRMKEPYDQGLASRVGPESCVGGREAAGEALTGAGAGRAIEPRHRLVRGCRRLFGCAEGNIVRRVNREGRTNPARSKTPSTHRSISHGSREISCSATGESPGPRRESLSKEQDDDARA